jgi:hypothetical protein
MNRPTTVVAAPQAPVVVDGQAAVAAAPVVIEQHGLLHYLLWTIFWIMVAIGFVALIIKLERNGY